MDRERAKSFCRKYADRRFYQPIVFVPGVIEIEGKWAEATKALAERILGDCLGKTVLDLGCLHGFFLHEAIRRGATRAVGIDHDVVEVKIAKEINEILDSPAQIIHARIEEYDSDQFDIVLLLNILHVLKEPQKNLRKIFEWVKDRLIIEHDPAHYSYFPSPPALMTDSPRCAGHRKLSVFNFS